MDPKKIQSECPNCQHRLYVLPQLDSVKVYCINCDFIEDIPFQKESAINMAV